MLKNKSIESDAALEAVLASNYIALAKIISEGQCNLNKKDNVGRTPLANALYIKDFQAAHMLIEAEADICTIDSMGFTLLHLIVKMSEDYLKSGYSQEEILDLVTKLASDMACGYQDRRGNTPINMAAQRARHKDIAELYIKMGKLLLSLDKNVSYTIQFRNNLGKAPLDYLVRGSDYRLRNVIHDRLPQLQEAMNDAMSSQDLEAQKLAALHKALVG